MNVRNATCTHTGVKSGASEVWICAVSRQPTYCKWVKSCEASLVGCKSVKTWNLTGDIMSRLWDINSTLIIKVWYTVLMLSTKSERQCTSSCHSRSHEMVFSIKKYLLKNWIIVQEHAYNYIKRENWYNLINLTSHIFSLYVKSLRFHFIGKKKKDMSK